MRQTMTSIITLCVCTIVFGTPEQLAAQRIDAVAGEPFGVANVTIFLPDQEAEMRAQRDGFRFADLSGRVFYPASDFGDFGNRASEFLGTDVGIASRLRVSFLFKGDKPFELTMTSPVTQKLMIRPIRKRPRQFDREMKQWWRTFSAHARNQIERGDYPPLVETYLVEMLSARFRLPKLLPERRAEREESQFSETVQLLFGAEELRNASIRQLMRGNGSLSDDATFPMPAQIQWAPLNFSKPIADVDVESIAMHVPEECFYIRFGSYQNYLWLNHLKDEYGGDIGRMITRRGHNARLEERFQKQLALKTSKSTEYLTSQVVTDIALIGRDLYLREGAAIGVVIEASNSFAVTASLTADRSAILNAEKENGATLKNIEIAGRKISFLSTPDNRIRSFYASSGQYHLVSTSHEIVRRFIECENGKTSLGQSDEFRNARMTMPLERDDTIFAYFSSAFFRGLLSPQYQVELARRLQTRSSRDLLTLARLAAHSENSPHESTQDLVAGGFLPPTFQNFDDNLNDDQNSEVYLTPIPDIQRENIGRAELAFYQRCAQYLRTSWPQMDPLMVGVKRFAIEGDDMERVVIDGNVSPLVEEKYGWLLSMVGPPTDVEIQSNPADIVKIQMTLQGGLLYPEIPVHHLFLSIQDARSPSNLVPTGFFDTWDLLKSTPGMLGAWPEMGLLNLISFLGTPADANGFSELPFGIWRWQGGGFSAVSFHRQVIAAGAAHLQASQTENPAQFRLRVGDLANSDLSQWITWANYSQAYQTSLGNTHLFKTLSQQLRVPVPEAPTLANQLLETEFVCALGGEYQLTKENGATKWTSTAWPRRFTIPETYKAPMLKWFRGASVDFTKYGDRLVLHAEIDMKRDKKQPEVKLPSFNFFGGKGEK